MVYYFVFHFRFLRRVYAGTEFVLFPGGKAPPEGRNLGAKPPFAKKKIFQRCAESVFPASHCRKMGVRLHSSTISASKWALRKEKVSHKGVYVYNVLVRHAFTNSSFYSIHPFLCVLTWYTQFAPTGSSEFFLLVRGNRGHQKISIFGY